MNKKLAVMYWSAFISLAMIVLMFETDAISSGTQKTDDNKTVEFVTLALMEALSVCSIPLLLKLPRFRWIRRRYLSDPSTSERRLFVISMARIRMFTFLLIMNAVFYYLFMNVAFGYMAMVVAISMAFVYPTKGRFESELNDLKE